MDVRPQLLPNPLSPEGWRFEVLRSIPLRTSTSFDVSMQVFPPDRCRIMELLELEHDEVHPSPTPSKVREVKISARSTNIRVVLCYRNFHDLVNGLCQTPRGIIHGPLSLPFTTSFRWTQTGTSQLTRAVIVVPPPKRSISNCVVLG
jgi:hypothetical protein